MEPTAVDREARCPRCGYDLRGLMAAWQEACPLAGRCAECGLEFAWAEVIGARIPAPRWCVESATSWVGLPWRTITTVAMTFWPWGFWKSLRMVHDVRWARLAAYVVLLILPLYLVVCAGHGMAAWCAWRRYCRCSIVSIPSPVRVVTQSALLPYSDEPPGLITMRRSRSPGTYTVWFLPPSEQPRAAWAAVLDSPLVPLTAAVLALCPAGLLALPASRRRAKVRSAHVVRVALYSSAFLLYPSGNLITGALWGQPLVDLGLARVLQCSTPLVYAVVPVLLVAWWGCAAGRYLKMKHAWGVSLAVVVMSCLAALLAAVVLYLLFG